jgi:hypothetical protein
MVIDDDAAVVQQVKRIAVRHLFALAKDDAPIRLANFEAVR